MKYQLNLSQRQRGMTTIFFLKIKEGVATPTTPPPTGSASGGRRAYERKTDQG